MKEKLLPCPFCGGEPKLRTHRSGEDSMECYVECPSCEVRTTYYEDAYAPVADARGAWNRRTPAPSTHLVGGDTIEYTLRAMTQNYAGGHSWDHLDGEACTKAADEIRMLRAGIKRLSDEEELCAETTGDDPFSLVHLAAKLAATESDLRGMRIALDQAWESNRERQGVIDRMRKALEPFAEVAGRFDGVPVSAILPQQCWFTPHSLREARAALATTEGKDNG